MTNSTINDMDYNNSQSNLTKQTHRLSQTTLTNVEPKIPTNGIKADGLIEKAFINDPTK